MSIQRVFVAMIILFLWACGDGSGGGVSVGTSVLPPDQGPGTATRTTSFVVLGVLAHDLTIQAGPGFAVMAAAGDPVTRVTKVFVGIRKVRMLYAKDCDKANVQEKEWEGPFSLSLTDGVMLPPLAPLAVSRSVRVCHLIVEWNGGSAERPEEGPPSLYVRGYLRDGRELEVRSDRSSEFEMSPAGGLAVTSDVVELNLDLPYSNWLQTLQPDELKDVSNGLVVVSEENNEGAMNRIESLFRRSGKVEKGEECPLSGSSFGKESDDNYCESEEEKAEEYDESDYE